MILSPSNFTRNVFKAGLRKPGCGILAVAALQRLIIEPIPCLSSSRDNRSTAPSDMRQMGALIAAGLAELTRASRHYVATQAGREWIEKLKSAGLIADDK